MTIFDHSGAQAAAEAGSSSSAGALNHTIVPFDGSGGPGSTVAEFTNPHAGEILISHYMMRITAIPTATDISDANPDNWVTVALFSDPRLADGTRDRAQILGSDGVLTWGDAFDAGSFSTTIGIVSTTPAFDIPAPGSQVPFPRRVVQGGSMRLTPYPLAVDVFTDDPTGLEGEWHVFWIPAT